MSSFVLPPGARRFTMEDWHNPPPLNSIPHLSPIWPLFGGVNMEIEVESLTILLDQLSLVLNNIPELSKYSWNQDRFKWDIEYASRPLEWIVEPQFVHWVNAGRWCALHTANAALERFPHLVDNDHDEYHPVEIERKWHRSEIRLLWNPVSSKYVIHFIRMTGDHHSFYYTWVKILTQLCDINEMNIPAQFMGIVHNVNNGNF